METCLAESCVTAATAGPSAFIFSQLIKALLVAQCSITSQQFYPVDRTDEILEQNLDFDFIVAGGGSAGSVVASRLSEINKWRVLLIESGEDPSFLSDIPGLMTLLHSSSENYDYKVEQNNKSCLGMKDKHCKWAKGRALGGSSVINAMLHVRGTDRDFNEWAELGNSGWSYEDVLPYFMKLENYHPDVAAKYKDKFGTGGPLVFRPCNYSESDMHDVILEAVRELNIPIIEMLNVDKYIGFGKAYGNLDNGVRQNVAKAYLNPVKDRKNLYVMKSTRVDSLIMDGNRVKGVKVTLKDGRKIELKANKEVILSAGSIASPQILMLSGIGPKEELKRHNIKTIVDLPVGKNLQDHVIWSGLQVNFANKSIVPVTPTSMLDWSYKYLIHRTGEFASSAGVDLLGFVNTKNATDKYPNVQFHFIRIPQAQAMKTGVINKVFNYDDELATDMMINNQQFETIVMGATLLKPKSIGEVKLRSADPEEPVEIHANYFENQEDVDVLVEAMDVVRSFLTTKPFKNAELRRFNIPGCAEYPTESREYWECNVRHTAVTIYHPVGTCKMAPKDKEGVVDSNLKVYGIKGLRVIDASVMPSITSGNTHAPTLMIAEKGSDLIKNEWLTKSEL